MKWIKHWLSGMRNGIRFVKNHRPVDFAKLDGRLSEQEMLELESELQALLKPWQNLHGSSRATQQGSLPSRALGVGMEYAESQPYQQGDDIRFLDWRQMAKRQQAYTKWFEPERLETWCLLAEFSPSMYFGTRQRLKVQQACRALGCFALLAQKRQAQLQLIAPSFDGAQPQMQVSPILAGTSLFQQVLAQVNQPFRATKALPFDAVLATIPENLPAGSQLVVVSDFHQLKPSVIMQNRLSYLAQRYRLTAIYIQDIAERQLPAGQSLQLMSVDGTQMEWLEVSQQADFQTWSAGFLEQQQRFLENCGLQVVAWQTDETLAQLLQRWERVSV